MSPLTSEGGDIVILPAKSRQRANKGVLFVFMCIGFLHSFSLIPPHKQTQTILLISFSHKLVSATQHKKQQKQRLV